MAAPIIGRRGKLVAAYTCAAGRGVLREHKDLDGEVLVLLIEDDGDLAEMYRVKADAFPAVLAQRVRQLTGTTG